MPNPRPRRNFEAVFDPEKMPGWAGRNTTLQGFLGGADINPTYVPQTHETGDSRNLQKVFNSGQVWQTIPSAKGKRS